MTEVMAATQTDSTAWSLKRALVMLLTFAIGIAASCDQNKFPYAYSFLVTVVFCSNYAEHFRYRATYAELPDKHVLWTSLFALFTLQACLVLYFVQYKFAHFFLLLVCYYLCSRAPLAWLSKSVNHLPHDSVTLEAK